MKAQVKDIYQSVTDQIIDALESGVVPWICPWRSHSSNLFPANLTTGRPYRGINVLLLNLRAAMSGFSANRWMTFEQARASGAYIRKGEQGTRIVFFKMQDVTAGVTGSGRETPSAEQSRAFPLLRSYTVFNASQIDALPDEMLPPDVLPEWDACAIGESILTSSEARILYGGDSAFYSPMTDFIQLPARSSFGSSDDFYRVALHELTHWTAHPDRCNRKLNSRAHLEAYAFEELVAEMGSAFLTNYCGLDGKLQHASYISNWLEALRNDKRLVFTAASQAQRAADFLLP
ncbi:MAG: zincin-like metallopeptidase domain-containing protein [Pseudomonadota bacterium]